MFNSSGAVEQFEVEKTNETSTIAMKVRGCGRFGAYSSQKPLKCSVEKTETVFDYEASTGLVTLSLPVPEEEMHRWSIEIQV